jgi:uncharacterized protein
MVERSDTPHLPRIAPIDAYGKGGFHFAGMSHRGSLLCLPSGIWAWPVVRPDDVDEAALARVFSEAQQIELFLLGTGGAIRPMPDDLRRRFRDYRIAVEVMQTGAAVRTYNVVLGESRRASAGLIAVD